MRYHRLGPLFRIMTVLQNASQVTLTNVTLAIAFNAKLYRLPKASIAAPVLLPGVANRIAIDVHSIDPFGKAGVIRILVVTAGSIVPLVSAAITMPRCDVLPQQQQQS